MASTNQTDLAHSLDAPAIVAAVVAVFGALIYVGRLVWNAVQTSQLVGEFKGVTETKLRVLEDKIDKTEGKVNDIHTSVTRIEASLDSKEQHEGKSS